MKVALGADHRGVALRRHLSAWLEANGHEAVQHGAQDDNAYDYPAAADAVVEDILSSQAKMGVLICGSGVGMSIRANRFPKIRAALCCDAQAAAETRRHNHANVLCLSADRITPGAAEEMLEAFLTTEEDHAERHERRVCQLG